jgi:hypothetical protein
MKKGLAAVLAIMMYSAMTGCVTQSAYHLAPGASAVSSASTFSVGEVKDKSGFRFPQGEESFDLANTMRSALQDELYKNSMLSGTGQYIISVNILSYAPGNAFKRWVSPFGGSSAATNLSVNASILDTKGTKIADIPVSRNISLGGAFTIGAYKTVFNDVAQKIISVISDMKNR